MISLGILFVFAGCVRGAIPHAQLSLTSLYVVFQALLLACLKMRECWGSPSCAYGVTTRWGCDTCGWTFFAAFRQLSHATIVPCFALSSWQDIAGPRIHSPLFRLSPAPTSSWCVPRLATTPSPLTSALLLCSWIFVAWAHIVKARSWQLEAGAVMV